MVKQLGWEVYAWALMDNDYHLVLCTPRADLVRGMTWFQNTVTKRLNGRHKQNGHLFAGRYKALMMEKGEVFANTINFVHQAPVRAKKFSVKSDKARTYAWTSLRDYLLPQKERAEFSTLKKAYELLAYKDSKKGKEELWNDFQKSNSVAKYKSDLRGGLVLGSEKFLNQTLQRLKMTKDEIANGFSKEELNKHREKAANKIIKGLLKKYGLSEKDLEDLPKNDWRKVEIVLAIRGETTVNAGWLGARLTMGTGGHISNSIRRYRELGNEAKTGKLKRKVSKKNGKSKSKVKKVKDELESSRYYQRDLPSHLL